jgi:hypothetical protein
LAGTAAVESAFAAIAHLEGFCFILFVVTVPTFLECVSQQFPVVRVTDVTKWQLDGNRLGSTKYFFSVRHFQLKRLLGKLKKKMSRVVVTSQP